MMTPIKKWWPGIAGLLLVLNLGTLVWVSLNQFRKPRGLDGPQLKEIIVKELAFDENQRELYYELVKEHQEQSSQIRSQIAAAKMDYYQFDQPNPSAINILKVAYGRLDSLNHAHFSQIRKICRQEQMEDFDEFLLKLLKTSNFGFVGPKSDP